MRKFAGGGYDRDHMDLSSYLDQLISSVASANRKTVVIMQSGTPVTIPWLEKVPSFVQAWYGGNEVGNAIADVLLGDVNPSCRLTLSIPVRNEDNPAYLSHKSELGRTVYTDDVFAGYRHYEKVGKKVNFAFGHGLSYTSFEYDEHAVSKSADDLEGKASVVIEAKNIGKLAGKEVVQIFVAPPAGTATTGPVGELK